MTAKRVPLSPAIRRKVRQLANDFDMPAPILTALLLETGAECLASTGVSLPLFAGRSNDRFSTLLARKIAEVRRPANILKLVPRKATPYLDYAILDYFGDNPAIARAARQLDRHAGVYLVGHLVALTETELRQFGAVTEEVLAELRATLEKIGLGFGMCTKLWSGPRPVRAGSV